MKPHELPVMLYRQYRAIYSNPCLAAGEEPQVKKSKAVERELSSNLGWGGLVPMNKLHNGWLAMVTCRTSEQPHWTWLNGLHGHSMDGICYPIWTCAETEIYALYGDWHITLLPMS